MWDTREHDRYREAQAGGAQTDRQRGAASAELQDGLVSAHLSRLGNAQTEKRKCSSLQAGKMLLSPLLLDAPQSSEMLTSIIAFRHILNSLFPHPPLKETGGERKKIKTDLMGGNYGTLCVITISPL